MTDEVNETSESAEDTRGPETQPRRIRRRWWVLGAVVTLLVLLLVPSFVNLGRFRRGIAQSISGSLGRPVHVDGVGLRLLPTPAFTLTNFVVGENPAFGYEPFMRANTVTATLHVSSLWRGRLEFATISLDSPSVNLVRNAAGEWNISSIVLQAEQIRTAPTEQRSAGSVPRFPYIEATQARVNVKRGDEKLPFSLTDAKLALWLSQPDTLHMRMEAHPLRTDMNATDTGLLQVEGTFQRATTLDAIPLQISASWRKAQLGDVSHMLMGEDAGWRGAINTEVKIAGHLGDAQVDAKMHLDDVRRAGFVPERTLSLDLSCSVNALRTMDALDNIHCAVPVGDGSLLMDGAIANLRTTPQAQVRFTAQKVPVAQVLEIARHASNRINPQFGAEGVMDGVFHYDTATTTGAQWQGEATLPALTMRVPGIAGSLSAENLHLHTVTIPATRKQRGTMKSKSANMGAVLDAFTLSLGAPTPVTIDGALHSHYYTMHLRGSVEQEQLLALAHAVPQFGDGIDTVLPKQPATTETPLPALPIALDATAVRTWTGAGMGANPGPLEQSGEVWTTTVAHKAARRR
jgi:AsmA protein